MASCSFPAALLTDILKSSTNEGSPKPSFQSILLKSLQWAERVNICLKGTRMTIIV